MLSNSVKHLRPRFLNKGSRLLFLYVLAVLFVGMLPSGAHAQLTSAARVELNDNGSRFFLGPNIYAVKDPKADLTSAIIVERHQNNLRGTRQNSEFLNFGANNSPLWLVFSITNMSSREDWVLHFGDVFDGRLGLLQDLRVENTSTGEIYIFSNREVAEGKPQKPIDGAGISVRITKGQTELFTVYMAQAPNLAGTFKPSLVIPEHYMHTLVKGTFLQNGFLLFMLTLTGFFLALSVIQKTYSYSLLAGYFFIPGAIFFLLQNNFVVTNNFLPILLHALYAASIVISMFLSLILLNFNFENQKFEKTVIAFSATIALSTMAGIFLNGSPVALDKHMFFLPLLFGISISSALAFYQKQKDWPGGLFLCVIWMAAFFALSLLYLTALGFASLGALSTNMYWLALFLQAGLLIVTALKTVKLSEEEKLLRIARENRATQSLARLKQSKETADQARLLRVIERERELMTDLREREIQRTQEMRKAKDMADEANRAKSAFLAVVSHEIRTPMNGIMGMVRLLLDTQMTKQQDEYLQAVQKSGDTMLALLNDILDFEKIESGNMGLEIIDFDMAKLIDGVITLMSGHATEKGLLLKSNIQDNFPPILKGDPTRLRQVLLNLVNNAIKFTADGQVTIHLKATPIDKKEADISADYEIYCAVQDTGIGLSEEAQKNLFTPFVQADKSTSRKYGGTGLGLAICRRLVEAMEGAIKVESAEGEGSTFFFNILLEAGVAEFDENAQDVGNKKPDRPQIPPLEILVIDDNEMNRRVLQGFLQKDNHKAKLCESGERGLELCSQQFFDAVITDIKLDGMDGMEFTRLLRQFPDQKIASTPVIALSGNISAEDRKDYERANMNGFLAKPIDPAALDKMLVKISKGDLDVPIILTPKKPPEIQEKQEPPPEPREQEIPAPETTPAPPAIEFAEETPDRPATQTPPESNAENEAEPELVRMIRNSKIEKAASKPILTFEDDDFDSFDIPENGDAQANVPDTENKNYFNPALLHNLAQSLPADQFKDLMDSFLVKTDELVEELLAMKDTNPSPEKVRNKAHELKGMSANFGLEALSALAAKIEKSGRDGDVPSAMPEIDKLMDVSQKSKNALDLWLKRL